MPDVKLKSGDIVFHVTNESQPLLVTTTQHRGDLEYSFVSVEWLSSEGLQSATIRPDRLVKK
jgi:hypothetical protein